MALALAASCVLFGAALRHLEYVTDGDGRSLCRIIFCTTLPAVMARTFATARMDASARAVACAGMVFGAACVLTSLTTTRAMRRGRSMDEITEDELVKMSRRSREALVTGATVGLNLGNFAYPLAEILFGRLALELTVVFDATNQIFLLVVAHVIYTVHTAKIDPSSRAEGDASIWGSVKQSLVRQSRNPCLLACAGAAAYRAMYGAGGFPPMVDAFLKFLADANKPLALLALGILFQPNMAKEDLRELACALARRYGAAMLCASVVLATMGSTLGTVGAAVVVLSMLSPLPLLTVTYAMEFALNVPFAATLVNYANVVSAFIIFLLSKVLFENPVALAPRLAVCGVLVFGAGALIRSAEPDESTGTARSVVVSALGDARPRAKNTWPTTAAPPTRARHRVSTLRANAVLESVRVVSRAAMGHSGRVASRAAMGHRHSRGPVESSAARRARFGANVSAQMCR